MVLGRELIYSSTYETQMLHENLLYNLVTKKVTRREGKGQYQSHTKTNDKPENHKVCKVLQTPGNRHRSRGDAWTKTDVPTMSD